MHNDIEFYDIFDYHEPSFWQTTWFKIVVILTLMALVTLILYLILRRKKKSIHPWQWAQQQLTLLSLEKCSSKNDYKKFYFELTTIIKQYFNKRYGWKTEDKTDEELTEYLGKQGFNETMRDSLKKMLEGAVWIKFAGESVIKTQAEADLKTALIIIEKTTPKETTK